MYYDESLVPPIDDMNGPGASFISRRSAVYGEESGRG